MVDDGSESVDSAPQVGRGSGRAGEGSSPTSPPLRRWVAVVRGPRMARDLNPVRPRAIMADPRGRRRSADSWTKGRSDAVRCLASVAADETFDR